MQWKASRLSYYLALEYASIYLVALRAVLTQYTRVQERGRDWKIIIFSKSSSSPQCTNMSFTQNMVSGQSCFKLENKILSFTKPNDLFLCRQRIISLSPKTQSHLNIFKKHYAKQNSFSRQGNIFLGPGPLGCDFWIENVLKMANT